MNTRRLPGVGLEKALAAKLRELLGGVAWLKGWEISVNPAPFERAFDLLATIPLPRFLTEKFADVDAFCPQQLVEFDSSPDDETQAMQARRAYELVQAFLTLL